MKGFEKMKKVLAVLLAATMLFGMRPAAPATETAQKPAVPQAAPQRAANPFPNPLLEM